MNEGLILLSVFVSTSLACLWAMTSTRSYRERISQRLEYLVKNRGIQKLTTQDIDEAALQDEEGRARSAQNWKQAIFEQADRLIAGKAVSSNLAARLRRAGLKLQVSEFIAFDWAFALFFGMLGWILTNGWLAVLFWGVGLWIPNLYLNSRIKGRIKAFEGQLPDALALMANSLKSGYSFLQAMEVCSRELPDPLASEFGQVMKEIRVNIPVEDALVNLTRRVPSDDLDLIVTAVLIQRQVGGNLAEVLDRISGTIRERLKILGEINTLTAQGRLSGWIISLLPIGIGLVMYILNPSYISALFYHPLGWALLGAATISQFIGVAIIRSIISMEV